MGFFKNLFSSKQEEVKPEPIQAEQNIVYAPLSGNAVELAALNDGVFSEGMLGGGCAIEPTEETVYAPFDGKVVSIADSKHAVGVENQNGVQVLIHVGLDTVNMNGDGFDVLVSEDQNVKTGDALLRFSKEKIQAAGYPDITAVLVVDQAGLETLDIEHLGEITHGEELIVVK